MVSLGGCARARERVASGGNQGQQMKRRLRGSHTAQVSFISGNRSDQQVIRLYITGNSLLLPSPTAHCTWSPGARVIDPTLAF